MAPTIGFTNPMLTARYYAPPARDLLGAAHKPTEKFRAVPPIASTIDHTGDTRLGARDQPCIRPAIGTQTPWHDSCWLQLSLGDLPQKHFLRRCNRSAIFEGIGSFGTSSYSFRTSFPTQILKARATRRSVSSAGIGHS